MFDLAVVNGKLVTPYRVYSGAVYVRDGKIAAISNDSTLPARETIDAGECLLFPGLIDSHAHFNDPGFTWREDFPHGSAAAAVGGVTTIVDMPLQNEPALTNATVFAAKQKALSGRSYVDYAFWGGLVDNLDDLEGLDEAGVAAFKAFIGPVSPDYSSINMGLVRQALLRLKPLNALAGFHCEDFSIIKAEEALALKEGRNTRQGFFETRPLSAELISTQSILTLARETGARVHICHISHPEVAELVRRARAEGVDVSGETCAHYLTFTREDLFREGTIFKCAPPLQNTEAREGLWEYVQDGTLACVASDHSPCRADEKDEEAHGVLGAWGGVSSVQSTLQTFYDQGVVRRGLCPTVIANSAAETARIFGFGNKKGRLEVGFDADIVLLDPEKQWKITPESLQYLNKISAFVGLEGKGLPVCTLVRGRVVAKDGAVVGPLDHGQLITKTQ